MSKSALRGLLLATLPALFLLTYACDGNLPTQPNMDTPFAKGSPGKPDGGEDGGNNLSFPVIWSEGVTKALLGSPGASPVLNGDWWYQWGTNGSDPNVTAASCPPDPDEDDLALNPTGLPLCDDGLAGSVDLVNLVAGQPAADNPLPLAKAFIQKDRNSIWQAGSSTPVVAGVAQADGSLYVDWIDWGDNLESVDWYTRSQVRTEVVLFMDNPDPGFVPVPTYNPWLEYGMRHTDGWGIDEVHGLEATLGQPPVAVIGPGNQATVYSPCARFTIQRLLVPKDDVLLDDLVWTPGVGWTEPVGYPDLVNDVALFNMAVHESSDGPGYYNAEINVKGRIIFGYTWNVRRLNEGAGDYRLTFSFDQSCGMATLNTFFAHGVTQIIAPEEEDLSALADADSSPGGGGTGVLVPFDDPAGPGYNLTYMDISILERGGGGNGGGGGGKGKNK